MKGSVPKQSAMDKKYQAQDDTRTMRNALEVMRDPKRHKAAMAEMQKMAEAMGMDLSQVKAMMKGKKKKE